MFDSLNQPEKKNNLEQPIQGSLFKTIEYEVEDLIRTIKNIDKIDDATQRNIIKHQHHMLLNYDLFLSDNETRGVLLSLFTNYRFLQNMCQVVGLLNLSKHEIICLNKISYDYYILPNNNPQICDLLYELNNCINSKQITVLSGIYGLANAKILSMIRNSTFIEEKAIHRVNTFIIKCSTMLTVDQIISTYCYLFERFTNVFIYTMLESRPSGLTDMQYKKYDNISIALLMMMDSLPVQDMYRLLCDYGFTIANLKDKSAVRFSLKTANGYPRIIDTAQSVKVIEEINIP